MLDPRKRLPASAFLSLHMQASLFMAALFHLVLFVMISALITVRTIHSYQHPVTTQSYASASQVHLPVVTVCPDEPTPAVLPRPPTCLFTLTQGSNTRPQSVSSRAVQTSMRAPSGHEYEYECYECNADRSNPLPATGISQLYLEINRTGGAAYSPTLLAYSDGAAGAEPPYEQLQWLRMYQQESAIHQLTARKLEKLSGDTEGAFDVVVKSLPCSQATRGGSCAGLSTLMVRYTRLDVLVLQEAPSLDALVALCALAGIGSCLLVSLRNSARLLAGAKGMPTEAETLRLISGRKPPAAFSDPYTGFQSAPSQP